MASMISSPPSTMAALCLPLSHTASYNSFARTSRFRVNSFIHKSCVFLPKCLHTRIFPVARHSKTTDHHHQHHGRGCIHHHHCHSGGVFKFTKLQLAFVDFAKAIKWTELADLLREHLEVCCFATALLLAATTIPYLVPMASLKHVQCVLALVAFPLVAVIVSF